MERRSTISGVSNCCCTSNLPSSAPLGKRHVHPQRDKINKTLRDLNILRDLHKCITKQNTVISAHLATFLHTFCTLGKRDVDPPLAPLKSGPKTKAVRPTMAIDVQEHRELGSRFLNWGSKWI
jgi:hypothetical protein